MEYQGFDKNFSLDGKAALITGGNAGIGRAIASLFAAKGAQLALVDRDINVTGTANELASSANRKVLGIVADLTQADDVRRAAAATQQAFGRIDILVNNAGIVLLDPAERLTDEAWDQTMAINLRAPFLMAREVGKIMIAQQRGKIVNIASQASFIALQDHVAYCASKAGLVGVTKVLAMEWGKYNVNVNAVSPTVVLTALGEKAWAGEKGEAMKKKIPVGRFAMPDEIAAAVLYLSSDAANMITGENLVIDGGFTIQ